MQIYIDFYSSKTCIAISGGGGGGGGGWHSTDVYE